MEQRQLGTSDVTVSLIGLGCNNFGGRLSLSESRTVVDAALAAGLTHLDTADIYGSHGGGDYGDSERFLGEILEGRRDRAVIATKIGNDMGDGAETRGAPAYIRRATEASLARLRTDYVDILYYHWPDGVTPVSETVDALEELMQEGKARAIACANLSAEQLREVGGRISALQNNYSLLERRDEAEVLPLCAELGIAYIPYFPLANGLLTGKHRRGAIEPGTRLEGKEIDHASFDRLEQLEAFAQAHGLTILELAIAALMAQPTIASVIAGATKPEQVQANAAAAAKHLSNDELAELLAL
jgi:aryl-alcohol dehydrogenase-like predicted oxidoreductase